MSIYEDKLQVLYKAMQTLGYSSLEELSPEDRQVAVEHLNQSSNLPIPSPSEEFPLMTVSPPTDGSTNATFFAKNMMGLDIPDGPPPNKEIQDNELFDSITSFANKAREKRGLSALPLSSEVSRPVDAPSQTTGGPSQTTGGPSQTTGGPLINTSPAPQSFGDLLEQKKINILNGPGSNRQKLEEILLLNAAESRPSTPQFDLDSISKILDIQKKGNDLAFDNPQPGDPSILGGFTVSDNKTATAFRKSPQRQNDFAEQVSSSDDFQLRMDRLNDVLDNLEGTVPLTKRTKEGAELSQAVHDAWLFAKGKGIYNLGVLTGPDVDMLEAVIKNPVGVVAQTLTPEDYLRLNRRIMASSQLSLDQKAIRNGVSRTYYFDLKTGKFSEERDPAHDSVEISSENSKEIMKALQDEGHL